MRKGSSAFAPTGAIDTERTNDGVTVEIRIESPFGGELPPDVVNARAITAIADDVLGTRLTVRDVTVQGNLLRLTVLGLGDRRRFRVYIAGLPPDQAEVTVSLDGEPQSVAAAPEADTRSPILVDYLAKDFIGFIGLMQDSIAHRLPAFEEHHADLGVAVLEILAYAADQLSYFQDAVATETYLETARRRVSVRRHARLVGYAVSEGCTPRAFVQIVPHALLPLGAGFAIATPTWLDEDRRVFETLHDAVLDPALSELPLWDYGRPGSTVLAAGSCRATIVMRGHAERGLRKDDVLIFEQRRGNGKPPPPLTTREAVRLIRDPIEREHPFDPELRLLHVEWHRHDALAHSYPASDARGRPATVALGNIVAADYGQTQPPVRLKGPRSIGGTLAVVLGNLTFSTAYEPGAPASALARAGAADALPALRLEGTAFGRTETWLPRRDLIGAQPYDRVFTVDLESDGSAIVRFGDGTNGVCPDPSTVFVAHYRIGNGAAGQVGPDVLVTTFADDDRIRALRNPLPSAGGSDATDTATARRRALDLAQEQNRCVADRDFITIAQRIAPDADVHVEHRWTGSWETTEVFVHAPGDEAFRGIERAIEDARLIGADVRVRPARRVAIVVVLEVVCGPQAHPEALRRAVTERVAADFAARRLRMGQPVFASWLIAAASAERGVLSVSLQTFRRSDGPDERAAGFIHLAPTEIAVLASQFGASSGATPTVRVNSYAGEP
jgi:hypothetical protein